MRICARYAQSAKEDPEMIQIALLAACGWFLLEPPVKQTGLKLENALSCPYSEWQQIRAFDTAQECEKDRKEIDRRALKDMIDKTLENTAKNEQERYFIKVLRAQAMAARCISSEVLLAPLKK